MAAPVESLFEDGSTVKRTFAWLNNLRKAGTLCDVTLCISDKPIPVHSNVLSVASPFFSTVLGVKDSESGTETEVEETTQVINPQIIHINVDTLAGNDKEIYFTALERLVTYIYTGNIVIEESYASQLLQLTKLLQIDRVSSFCLKFLNDIAASSGVSNVNAEANGILFVTKPSQNSTDRYKCKSCNFVGGSQRELRDHRHLMHINKVTGINVCSYCDLQYSDRNELETHKKLHTKSLTDSRFPCAFCNKGFNWKWELRKHMVRHSTVKTFICPFCNGRYKREVTLRKHIELHKQNKITPQRRRIKHIDDLPQHAFSESELYRVLLPKNELFSLQKSDGTKKRNGKQRDYSCHECKYQSTDADEIEQHLLKEHKIGDLTNDSCVFVTPVRRDLPKNASRAKRIRFTGEFACKKCDKVFNMKHVLRRHELDIHTNARPFKCSVCDFDTKRRGNLKDHMWYRHKLRLGNEKEAAVNAIVASSEVNDNTDV